MWILELHHKVCTLRGLGPRFWTRIAPRWQRRRGSAGARPPVSPASSGTLHGAFPTTGELSPPGGPGPVLHLAGQEVPSRGFRFDHPLFGAAPPTHACMLHLRDGAGSSGHGFWAQGFLQMGRTWGLRLQDQHPWTLRAYPPTSLIKEPSHSSRSGRARAPHGGSVPPSWNPQSLPVPTTLSSRLGRAPGLWRLSSHAQIAPCGPGHRKAAHALNQHPTRSPFTLRQDHGAEPAVMRLTATLVTLEGICFLFL